MQNEQNPNALTGYDLERVAGGQIINGYSTTTAVVGGNVVTYGYVTRPALYGLGYGLGLGYGYGGYPFADFGLPGPGR
jgi:hypothetical protein